jgi:hypothetical protein
MGHTSLERELKQCYDELLVLADMTDEVAVELANLGMISLSLKLINQLDYKVQYHAACLFNNITSRTAMLR